MATTRIKRLNEHSADTSPGAIVTFTADSSFVHVVKTGRRRRSSRRKI